MVSRQPALTAPLLCWAFFVVPTPATRSDEVAMADSGAGLGVDPGPTLPRVGVFRFRSIRRFVHSVRVSSASYARSMISLAMSSDTSRDQPWRRDYPEGIFVLTGDQVLDSGVTIGLGT
jgi:hypothetical protein